MSLDILIIGAGVCGPALALLLQYSHARHNITVIERSPSLRVAGQQIDLKDQGLPIARKLGLLDTIKSHCVEETGFDIVDSNGKRLVHMGINDPENKKKTALTHEYEIMRGDLVDVLYRASLDRNAKLAEQGEEGGNLTYEFGKTATDLDQNNDGVDVTFSDGQKRRYGLVVAADGQGSRTRRMVFGQQANDDAFKSFGMHAGFYSIPRVEGEGGIAKGFITHGNRGIMTRTGENRSRTQVYLFAMKNKDTERLERLKAAYKEPVEKQKEVWTEYFQGAGWECDRLLGGIDTCEDFYAYEVAQVKMKQLHSGRVVLLGDAGYCPTPLTGMGTTASLVGAYVLAGELARHGSDVGAALQAYEEVLRTPIDIYQKMLAGAGGFYSPSSRFGAWCLHNAMRAMSSLRIDRLFQRILIPDSQPGWAIPEYPELNLLP